jgi:hypothetical protein
MALKTALSGRKTVLESGRRQKPGVAGLKPGAKCRFIGHKTQRVCSNSQRFFDNSRLFCDKTLWLGSAHDGSEATHDAFAQNQSDPVTTQSGSRTKHDCFVPTHFVLFQLTMVGSRNKVFPSKHCCPVATHDGSGATRTCFATRQRYFATDQKGFKAI